MRLWFYGRLCWLIGHPHPDVSPEVEEMFLKGFADGRWDHITASCYCGRVDRPWRPRAQQDKLMINRVNRLLTGAICAVIALLILVFR